MIVYIVLMAYLLLIASFVLKNHVRVITLRGLGKPRQIRDNIACCLLTAIPLIVFFVIRDLHVGTDTIGIYQNIYFNGYGLNGWTPYLYEGLFKYSFRKNRSVFPVLFAGFRLYHLSELFLLLCQATGKHECGNCVPAVFCLAVSAQLQHRAAVACHHGVLLRDHPAGEKASGLGGGLLCRCMLCACHCRSHDGVPCSVFVPKEH